MSTSLLKPRSTGAKYDELLLRGRAPGFKRPGAKCELSPRPWPVSIELERVPELVSLACAMAFRTANSSLLGRRVGCLCLTNASVVTFARPHRCFAGEDSTRGAFGACTSSAHSSSLDSCVRTEAAGCSDRMFMTVGRRPRFDLRMEGRDLCLELFFGLNVAVSFAVEFARDALAMCRIIFPSWAPLSAASSAPSSWALACALRLQPRQIPAAILAADRTTQAMVMYCMTARAAASASDPSLSHGRRSTPHTRPSVFRPAIAEGSSDMATASQKQPAASKLRKPAQQSSPRPSLSQVENPAVSE